MNINSLWMKYVTFFKKGGLVALDNLPPFIIRFDRFPEDFSEDLSAEYDYAYYPGARAQYPIFKNMTPKVLSFTTTYDITDRNEYFYGPLEIIPNKIEGIDLPNGSTFYFKGPGTAYTNVMQSSRLDYISVIQAAYEKLVLPKGGASSVAQNIAGKILQVSQGKSDPSPPLTMFIKNYTRIYLGYLAEAKPKELNVNYQGICTRIQFACKYLVTPDLIFDTFDELMRELSIIKITVDTLSPVSL